MDTAPLVASVLLTHESPRAVARMIAYWQERDPDHPIIVAYGGERAAFDALDIPHAVYVEDPELRTRDHPRERQSYLGVFKAVLPLIRELGATHVHVAEDHEIPLVEGTNARLLELMAREQADVVGHRLFRVDNSSHPHYTFHRADPAFEPYWEKISCREQGSRPFNARLRVVLDPRGF